MWFTLSHDERKISRDCIIKLDKFMYRTIPVMIVGKPFILKRMRFQKETITWTS